MSNLSSRTAKVLQQLLPKAAARKAAGLIPDDNIEASSAENSLLRSELGKIIAEAIAANPLSAILSFPGIPGGSITTRTALANFFNDYFRPSTTVSSEQVILTAGAGSCIEVLIQSICDEGDSVLVANPSWFGYFPCISGRPAVNIIPVNPTTLNTVVEDTVSSLESAYNHAPEPNRIKALILTNPQNPLARCYSKDALLKCLKFCQDRNLHFISNEIYGLTKIGANTEHEPSFISVLSIVEEAVAYCGGTLDKSRIHVVWSASKLFGLSGLRIGCVVSQENPDLRTAVSLLTYANTTSLSSTILTAVLNSPHLHSLIETNSHRLEASYTLFCKGLERLEIPYISATHGIFVFVRIARFAKSVEEEDEVFGRVQAEGVTVSPGRLYGVPGGEFGWARITFAMEVERVELMLERIERALVG